jgi:hypothetical protein
MSSDSLRQGKNRGRLRVHVDCNMPFYRLYQAISFFFNNIGAG